MRSYEESYFCISFVIFNLLFQRIQLSKVRRSRCVDAHMRVWELTPWKEEGNKKKNIWKKVETTKNINSFIRRNIMSSMTGSY